jgi:hypothetical protein
VKSTGLAIRVRSFLQVGSKRRSDFDLSISEHEIKSVFQIHDSYIVLLGAVWATMLRVVGHALIVFVLTIATQLGGVAWLVALFARRRVPAFLLAYVVLSVSSVWVAPIYGRIPLSCTADGPLRVQSWFYCVLNRHYVSPKVKETAEDFAQHMDRRFPGTVTLALDANFPYLDSFPLLPHLSHDDGQKLDFAFYYRDANGTYVPGLTRSPIGYFAFEPGPVQCRSRTLSLRWDLEWLQWVWKSGSPDPDRMKAALQWFANDARIGKVFIEPHLKTRFGVTSAKVRFQGCAAARHDDHIHVQL